MKITLSKAQWEKIGQVANWSKDDPKFGNDLSFMTDEDWNKLESRRKLKYVWQNQSKWSGDPASDETMPEDFVRKAIKMGCSESEIIEGLADFYHQAAEVGKNIYDRVVARMKLK